MSADTIDSAPSINEEDNVRLRKPELGSGGEAQLDLAEVETGTIDKSAQTEVDSEVEQISRAFPIWIDNRRSIDSNSQPYDWCVSKDAATKDDSPKGLLFVKLHKSGSSTGAGVTLRIRGGLSRRLSRANTTAPVNCFAHYNHATARDLNLQKRDPSKSFLWSIVREPAERSLSHFFYFDRKFNHTVTEDMILNELKMSKPDGRIGGPQNHLNYQSKYLDLPSQSEDSSSTPADRIINGYDFLAVNERMDESLVVLAMLARIPLADVVVFSSKIAGEYAGNNREGCWKIIEKWTTPKIDEYILGDYKIANRDDYLLYHAAQRSLDKTIDALGRQRVEENVALLNRLQQQNEEQCVSKAIYPCPEPEDEEKKREHKRLTRESCYFNDSGCGHVCTIMALADHAEAEWASLTS